MSTLARGLAREHKTPFWVTAWILISSILVIWDVGYCLSRPHSFHGGKYHWLWAPYALYQKVDLVYSPGFFERGEGFTSAQAILNIFEVAINLAYLRLVSIKSPVAILWGFVGATLTFWKTVLYWLQDQQCGWCLTGHNTRKDWWILFALPNGFWVMIPAILMYVFGKELAAGLRAGARHKSA